jgi:PAS domain S-box-containing protein
MTETRRRQLAVAAATVMFVAFFVARLEIENPNDAIGIFYVIPIALLAVEFGVLGGLISAAVGLGLFLLWVVIEQPDVSAVGYIARIGTYFPVGVIVGSVSNRLRDALDASRRAEERIRSILDSTAEAFIAADADGRITAWNPAAERTFGWRASDVIGRRVEEVIVPPESVEAYRREIIRFLETQTGLVERPFEWEMLHRDGHRFPTELTISPLRVGGRWTMTAFLRDITERKREDRVREQLASIVESSNDVIISSSLDGTILSWNPAAERLYGYTLEEAVGQSIMMLAPPERREEISGLLDRIRRGGTVERLETQRVGKDGTRHDVSISVSPLRDPEGRVYGTSAVTRDISQGKLTERYLRMQHGVSRVLAEGPPIEGLGARLLPVLGAGGNWTAGAYWRVEEEGKLYCASAWAADAPPDRLPVEEGQLRDPPDGLPREPALAASAAENRSLPGGQAADAVGLRAALWIPIGTGARLVGGFELFAESARRGERELIAAVGAIASQVGSYVERRHAELESERLKDEFFSLISHEMRTPLTSIIGYTELLAEIEVDRLSEQGRRFVEVVDRNARRELRLVQDLLLLVRVEAGRFSIDRGTVELESLIDDAIEEARPRAEAAGLELTARVDGVPPLEGDPHRLAQVLDNLLTNAIKFTPEGGRVTISARVDGDEAVIEVADTGIGIPEEEQARLFERLFRASTATDLQIPGTGLGLTIVKAVVDAHGGAIAVRSEEGAGTTFAIRLPLRLPGSPPNADRDYVAAAAAVEDEGSQDARRDADGG